MKSGLSEHFTKLLMDDIIAPRALLAPIQIFVSATNLTLFRVNLINIIYILEFEFVRHAVEISNESNQES